MCRYRQPFIRRPGRRRRAVKSLHPPPGKKTRSSQISSLRRLTGRRRRKPRQSSSTSLPPRAEYYPFDCVELDFASAKSRLLPVRLRQAALYKCTGSMLRFSLREANHVSERPEKKTKNTSTASLPPRADCYPFDCVKPHCPTTTPGPSRRTEELDLRVRTPRATSDYCHQRPESPDPPVHKLPDPD